MRFWATTGLMLILSTAALSAKNYEKKGSFGVVVNQNFVKFTYVLTYLGDTYKEDYYAFRLDFEDNKGYDLASEISSSETVLKNNKNEAVQGEIERQTTSSLMLLFPKKDDFLLGSNSTVYTVIMGYKLKKIFEL